MAKCKEDLHPDDPRYAEEMFIDPRRPETRPKPAVKMRPMYFFGWRIACFFGFHHKTTFPRPLSKWSCLRCRKIKWK